MSGWRRILAADPILDSLFRACEQRIGELAHTCPERRDLVHGDLLNRNVLIAEDLSEVTAVFSWKCSVRGDFLFDVAWCTFWGPWHPGIAAVDLWTRTVQSPTLTGPDLRDAALRCTANPGPDRAPTSSQYHRAEHITSRGAPGFRVRLRQPGGARRGLPSGRLVCIILSMYLSEVPS